MVGTVSRNGLAGLEEVSNDAEELYGMATPFVAEITIEGIAPFLYHRWSVESIDTKAKAAKGSKAKKSDDVESYVWRTRDNTLAIPGEYLRQSIINAAKYHQDPRSPRKSAMDMFKAGVISLTELAPVGKEKWDYLDQRRVMIQRNGITRQRPALEAGWQATFEMQVQLPEYIPASLLNLVTAEAGRLVGVGDFRPSYGRFVVVNFHVQGE